MKNILFVVLFMVSSSAILFAQQTAISGVVMDAKTNIPIENATVQIKTSNIFTITDIDGKFTLNASKGAVLIISHINYQKKILKVSSDIYEIRLQPISINLNDIIVKANVLQDISQSDVIIDNTKATTNREMLVIFLKISKVLVYRNVVPMLRSRFLGHSDTNS